MRIRVSRGAPSTGTGRSSHQRKVVLDIDINAPPSANVNEVGTSSRAHPEAEVAPQVAPPQSVAIDVDLLDDDVILVSPRAFVEAKNKSRRNRGRINAPDVQLGILGRHRNKREKSATNQAIINCESYIDLESNGNTVPRSTMPPSPHLPHRPPRDPTFSCPVCMGPVVEETSTKCGHIFCKACLKLAIAAQGKCPTCRKKVTMKSTFRIYLPATATLA